MLAQFSTEEVEVAVVLVFESPSLTQERYEESIRRLTPEGTAGSPADWPTEGLLAHIAGQGPNGFRVVDVWESEEAVARFGEVLIPVLRDIGVEGEPEIYPAHTFVGA
jgi:hypothetical protein